MEFIDVRKKIKREKPNKKWSSEEIKIILNYLEEAAEIEVPTAQMFYKKLISKTGINASWELVRWKVRYLQTTYKKANDWRSSTGAGLLECDTETSSVDAKITQMCPYYRQLSNIFGPKKQPQIGYEIVDTGQMDESCIDYNTEELPDCIDYETINDESSTLDSHCNAESSECIPVIEISVDENRKSPKPEISKKAKEFAEKMKKVAPKSSSAYLAAFQAERTALFKLKFDWEKARHEKETEFNTKKIAIEEEKSKADIELNRQELELKAREIERDERLRVLEIEKDERLKRFEIEMKYKDKASKDISLE